MARSKAPRSSQAAPPDHRAEHRPLSVKVAAVSWVLVGITLLLARVGAPTPNQNPVAPGVSSAIGSLEQNTAPTLEVWWWVPYLPVVGVVVLLLAGMLLLRQGWARFVLVLLGLIAIIGFAEAGQWHVIPATVFLVVGAAASVLPSAHRYLARRPRPAPDGTARATA